MGKGDRRSTIGITNGTANPDWYAGALEEAFDGIITSDHSSFGIEVSEAWQLDFVEFTVNLKTPRFIDEVL